MREKYKLIFVGLILIAIDQIVKYLILHYFSTISVINPKGGFSFGFESVNFAYISIAALFAFTAILLFFEKSALKSYGFVMIISGTISNLIDRFSRDGVVDYIDFKIWPTFNIADSLIVIGVGLLIIREFRKNKAN